MRSTKATRWILIAVGGILGTLLAPAGTWADTECRGKHVRVDVTVDYADGGSVDVPESVEIFLDEAKGATRVCWQIAGLADGDSLTIAGKAAEDDHFPQLEMTATPPRVHLNSGPAQREGTFRYGLTVTGADGTVKIEKDPEVVIRG